MTPTLYAILSIFFLIIAVVLILVILVQRGRGGGLVGAFGGPGGS
ncbi:MAG: preprotein translocase subunit SecG, partial [Phycisphaerae bacterium]|nr:preprotein translocase subunit SecG [Phycisphaerae bacterium]